MYPDDIRPIEKPIIDRIVKTALERGWTISVFDSEEWPVKRSRDYETITANISTTDLTQLKFRDSDGNYLGVVIFVHGNDEDVICDCTDNPEMLELCDDPSRFR